MLRASAGVALLSGALAVCAAGLAGAAADHHAAAGADRSITATKLSAGLIASPAGGTPPHAPPSERLRATPRAEHRAAGGRHSLTAWILIARLRLETHGQRAAVRALRDAARRAPDDPAPLVVLALLRERAGQRSAARRRYRRALALAPTCALAANNLACELARSPMRRREALRLARAADAGLPGDTHVAETLGWALARAGHTQRALPYLARSARAFGTDAGVAARRAWVLAASGRAGAAREELARAFTLDPQIARQVRAVRPLERRLAKE